MSKLTDRDILLVETFFASPMGARFATGLAAQSYEPRGSGYQPSTDLRLAGLVLHGVRPGKSAWTMASCVVDQLCGRPGGGVHLDVIHRYGNSRGRASVGALTARALAYGYELAKDAERMATLEREYRECVWKRLSGFETTARVLTLDTNLQRHRIEVSLEAVRRHAFDAVQQRLINVDAEIDALLDAAAEAMQAARARVDVNEAAAKAQKEKRGADLRAELAGKRDAKEREKASKRTARRAAALLADCVRLRAAS